MINSLFSRTALHEHAEPAQRVLGAAELPPDSDALALLLSADPAPEVRIAAARRCAGLTTLAAALEREHESAVKVVIASALGHALAETQDSAAARALLEGDGCTDDIRLNVARHTPDADRRRAAIAGMRDENLLVELALAAGHAETRMAAAARVNTPDGLRRIADAAKNKDHGVARLARQRIDAIEDRAHQAAEADAILEQLEYLPGKPGPILTAVVELDRRWQALDMSGDADRLARHAAARQALQARFDRENDEQRARTGFERRLRDWSAALEAPAAPDALAALRAALTALRAEAQGRSDSAALAALDNAEQRIALWEQERQALAEAEAIVAQAEQLAAGAPVDHANLLQRWQALNRAVPTPAMTQRFEAAMKAVEQHRLAQVQAAQQEAAAARHQIHGLLHAAEQALAAGQLQAARAAADNIKLLKPGAGTLPKPSMQRLNRLVQQLVEMERWESFGQQNARIQLCERAEAAAALTLDAPQLALEVQKLRNEWKALDQQYAAVPRKLWKRFDEACEKAYAPAAKHFAELAAHRKEARRQREEFIATAAAHAPTLLGEPRDWRAIERWLRDTAQAWREGELGSVEPGAWKKLDGRLKTALGPLRDALSAACEQAKSARQILIAEAAALAAKATERDTLSQVKALQAKWQEQAKLLTLARRDERELWEQFRAACDAVFTTRDARRKEEDGRKHESRRALEETCAQVEQLALAADKSDPDIRRALRELQDQWKKQTTGSGADMRAIETRFRNARTAVESALAARARSREAAVWQTLAAKERLCEELDGLVRSNLDTAEAVARAAATQQRWTEVPAMSKAWEQAMDERRDAALRALSDPAAAGDHVARIDGNASARREGLLELELLLGLDSPAELQAQRLALQVKQLRDRFKNSPAVGADTASERLLAWCAQPGVAEGEDRQRCERIFSKMEKAR